MKITFEQLPPSRKRLYILGLCGVEVTEELCVRYANDFDWSKASKLLATAAVAEYERAVRPAWEAYNRIERPIWEAFMMIALPARDKYDRISYSEWGRHEWLKTRAKEEYQRISDLAQAEYENKLALPLAEFNLACAKAFYAASKI